MLKRASLTALFVWTLVSLTSLVWAHEAIDRDRRIGFERQIADLAKDIAAAKTKGEKADKTLALANLLEQLRSLFNQDIQSHGRLQGLETQLTLQLCQSRGWFMQAARTTGRYKPELSLYELAFTLAPGTAIAGRATYAYLLAHFYESLDGDPLAPPGQSAETTRYLIKLGDAVREDDLAAPEREELAFIRAMHLMQAFRQGLLDRPGAQSRVDSLLSRLRQLAPEGLKTITIQTLRQSL